jgi:hypothetical protein
MRRTRQLAGEVARLRSRPWHLLMARLCGERQSASPDAGRRQLIDGHGPFFERGFQRSDAAMVAGTAIRRVKDAPSGTLIYGPYIRLCAGTYAVAVEARRYQRLPPLTSFKLEVVHDGAQQVIAIRQFRVYRRAEWQRFETVFTIRDGEESADFEFRVWGYKGSRLEIGAIDLYQLPPTVGAEP